MTERIKVQWDQRADVLYVIATGSRVARSEEAPGDPGLILDLDATSRIVGVRLLEASETSAEWWRAHPDVDFVPEAFRLAIEAWLLDHATGALVLARTS